MASQPDAKSIQAFLEDSDASLKLWREGISMAKTATPNETYRALARAIHNLKGNAGILGADKMHSAMVKIEDHLIDLQKTDVHPGKSDLGVYLSAIELWLVNWTKNVTKDLGFEPKDQEPLLAFLRFRK